jgi:hypothetical protein
MKLTKAVPLAAPDAVELAEVAAKVPITEAKAMYVKLVVQHRILDTTQLAIFSTHIPRVLARKALSSTEFKTSCSC